jgi:hypothetical protein
LLKLRFKCCKLPEFACSAVANASAAGFPPKFPLNFKLFKLEFTATPDAIARTLVLLIWHFTMESDTRGQLGLARSSLRSAAP